MSDHPQHDPDNQTAAEAPDARRIRQLGDFELKKKLGQGGMGEVFLARQISLDRLVALKTLSRKLAGQNDFVLRFQREARSMARLDHPNVVRVFSVDCQRGIHFAAIEYIDGHSAQYWLEKLQRLPIGDAVHLALICAEALHHAHSLNMVHRDIKPDNILITRRGQAKLADFGLAKALDEDVSMTQSGTGMGTPLYMAPEQARNAKHVDGRSDIYALGATLYHLMIGQPPFSGSSALDLIIAKEKGSYPTARSLRPDVPERLDLMIDKMMARNPAHRYRDCQELITDLSGLALHNSALSFIDGAESFAVTRSGSSGESAVGSRSAARATASHTGDTSPGRSSNTTTKPSAAGENRQNRSQTWFVQFVDESGKMLVEKHSTGRIQKMIASGRLNSDARAKVSAEGNYLPLSKFREFSDAVVRQSTAQTAVLQKKDMDRLYAKVVKAEASRHKWRTARNLFQGLVGWTSLIIWVGGILVVAWLGYMYGGQAVRQAAMSLGFDQQPGASAPADEPVGNAAMELPE